MQNLVTKLRGIPIWVTISGIIALVLVGVVVSSIFLGNSFGNSDGGRRMQGMGSMQGMNHNGGNTGSMTPSESQPAHNPVPSHHPTPTTEGGPSDGANNPTATPAHGSGNHTPSGGNQNH